MNATLHLLATLVLCTALIRLLAGARWVWRSPRTGILLWQLLTLTWVLGAVGSALAIGLAPYGRDIPTAFGRWFGWLDGAARPAGFTAAHATALAAALALSAALVAALVWSWLRAVRTRRRHRRLLSLVARADADLPGVLILDHPLAVAYCLPGWRARVVLSSGALSTLSAPELSAVLAHEQTHARERHDLVLLPFTALRRLLPWSRTVVAAAEAVALLVEMRADEGACRAVGAGSLAAALRRFDPAAGVTPVGAIGMTGSSTLAARLSRLAHGTPPLPPATRWLALAGALVLVSTPLSFLVV